MLKVLDVGDGACSILLPPGGIGPVTVIDCGSNSLRGDEVCDRLITALDGRVADIETMIVTHFDMDHYSGFLRLAERMRSTGDRFGSLTLICPTVPSVSFAYPYAQFFLALATTRSGFRSLDLATALREVTNGELMYRAVVQGETFEGAGHEFRIHWPPSHLERGVAGQVEKAVHQFEILAEALRWRGDSTLAKNLDRVRDSAWMVTGGAQSQVDGLRPEWMREIVEPGYDDFEGEELQGDDTILQLDLPADLSAQFREAWNAFKRANNNMSIVFDDPIHRHLVAFGDSEPPILREISRAGVLSDMYSVMLAPHHGTHALPRGFDVGAVSCISQNGAKRHPLWHKHRETHRHSGHCRTTASGDCEIGARPTWCPYDTRR